MCCKEGHHDQPQTSHDFVNTSYGDDGWCICPGNSAEPFCCGFATKQDGYCDRCREHCKQDHPQHAPATDQDDAEQPAAQAWGPFGGDLTEVDGQFTPAELARAAGEFGSDAVERHVEVSAVS